MRKYLWLVCLGGMLGACNPSDHPAKENTETTAITETAASDVAFRQFADQFKTVSLPYTLDTSQIANGYEEEVLVQTGQLKIIDKALLKTYLGSAKVETLQEYVEEADAQEGEPRISFYAISQPVRTDAFTALVIGCYDAGFRPDATAGYAFLCTFNPAGQFIAAVPLAEAYAGHAAAGHSLTVTKGTISADLGIETTTTEATSEFDENEDQPKESVSSTVKKYRVAADGTISSAGGEQ